MCIRDRFIVITGNPDSPLAKESDVCLSTGKPAEVCVLGCLLYTSNYDMSSLKAGPNCMAVDKKGRIFVGTGGTYQLHMFLSLIHI